MGHGRIGKLLIWSVKDLCHVIQEMTNNEFDCIIFIEGKRGLGKSTLAFKLARKLRGLKKFRPRHDICYSRKQVISHLAKQKKSIIFADEMINVSYNRDFYVEDQKILLKGLNMYRDSCNVFMGCIPRFIDLDIQIQRLCKIRITVVRRGVALIQTQRATVYSPDPWDIKNNMRIESKWTERGIQNPRYSQLTTVRGILKFNKLNPRDELLYKKIKEEKRNRVYSEEADLDKDDGLPLEEKQFLKLYNLVKNKSLTPNEFDIICSTLGMKNDMIRNKLRKRLKDEGIREGLKTLIHASNESNPRKQDILGFAK